MYVCVCVYLCVCVCVCVCVLWEGEVTHFATGIKQVVTIYCVTVTAFGQVVITWLKKF